VRTKRKVIVNMIENGKVNNTRLAEYFANKFKERGIEK
jgi:hypothetical protein